MTTDDITVVESAIAGAGPPPTDLPHNEPIIEPLDLLENPNARTKLRLYAILVALYVHYPVHYPILALSESHVF